eukprot:5987933-Amphidinium_carterae.1
MKPHTHYRITTDRLEQSACCISFGPDDADSYFQVTQNQVLLPNCTRLASQISKLQSITSLSSADAELRAELYMKCQLPYLHVNIKAETRSKHIRF